MPTGVSLKELSIIDAIAIEVGVRSSREPAISPQSEMPAIIGRQSNVTGSGISVSR